MAEQCYFAICRRLHNQLKASALARADELNDKLADKYICNFSVFQSLPDTWAIGQILPILPLNRLDEELPLRRAVLQDLTCDSDGKIRQYVDERSIETSLPVHEVREGGATCSACSWSAHIRRSSATCTTCSATPTR